MADETETPTDDADPGGELIDEATDLIGTDKLWSGQLLYSSVQLGIMDRLGDEPVPAGTIAEDLDLHPDNCYRLLRALGHFGVLEEDQDRRFSLAPVGELFRTDHPQSVRHHLLIDRSPEWVRPMLHLAEIVEDNGPNGFVREFGCDFFEYLERNPAFGEVFNDHMTGRSTRETEFVLEALEAYDFSRDSHVCDVGGGHGHLLCRLLETYPHLTGTVLELESVVQETDRLWAPKVGVADRCSYEAGDMFDAVPAADAYFMKFILHDWADDECIEILSNVHEAAPTDGRLFIVEAVVPGPETPHFAKRLDMTMMVHVGGRERTEAEYGRLLQRAGWTLNETRVPEEGPLTVLEAVTG